MGKNVWKFGVRYVDTELMLKNNIVYAFGDSMPTYLKKKNIGNIKKGDIVFIAKSTQQGIKKIGLILSEPFFCNAQKIKKSEFLHYKIKESKEQKIIKIFEENRFEEGRFYDVVYCNVNWLDINPKKINVNFNNPIGFTIVRDKNNIIKYVERFIKMKQYKELLSNNRNLILTGAPGTGKTYLAKQMALKFIVGKDNEKELTKEEQKLFNQHYGFVQFHPSYDYTDFVEGLRPIKTDEKNLGFELKNGIFKEFCKRALEKNNEDNFDEIYEQFIDDLSENSLELETPTYKKKFRVVANSNRSCFAIPDTETATQMSITKEMIRSYLLENKTIDWKPYTIPIGNYLKNKYNYKSAETSNSDRPYVFVIDEINRAEISKVFGELFFSIDPGYRGEKGKVQTQYANLIQEGDPFKEGFYVPENVYIIGTMNDIDRSVESFDFAMRRRFAWREIKASERMSMIDEEFKKDEKLNNENLIKEAKDRLIRLNKAIYNEDNKQCIEGLNSSYHIGPAYFLKLKSYANDEKPFDKLWEYHLEGLLREYLRGLPDVEGNIKALKDAYDNVPKANA